MEVNTVPRLNKVMKYKLGYQIISVIWPPFIGASIETIRDHSEAWVDAQGRCDN